MKPLMISITIASALAFGFLSAGCTKAAITGGTLIKGSSSAVYYVSDDGGRYVFPNSSTYNSWHQETRQNIINVNDKDIATLPLAGNITIRPGAYLIKIQTDPKVYAVGVGGYLHWITSEKIARELYGNTWNKQVIDVPDVFFVNYSIDTPIYNSAAYNKSEAMQYANNIEADLSARNTFSDDGWMNAGEKQVMYSLTNLFESGEFFPSYAIIETLDDGRGYTSGKSGFTTATGDANLVVKRYNQLRPGNVLSKYTTRLEELANTKSDSLSGLSGYPEAWQRAALDPLFRQAQNEITDELYYLPAMRAADSIDLDLSLSRAFIYDTIIQHGNGNDPDGLNAIIGKATQNAGGSPADGIPEKEWLQSMLEARQNTLLNATDPQTREVWAESAYRVNVYRTLLNSGNVDLITPITIKEKWINTVIK
ncbi:MAG: chitosanase [Patescibacteria group bacterium]|nr:chitosanase [Patescibacteria group bacterium]